LLRLDLAEPDGYQFLHQRLRKRLVDREMQRTLCARVARKFVVQVVEHRSAVRQIREVVLEGREPRDHLAVQPERRHAIGDDFVGIREYLADRLPQFLQRCALRLVDLRQVVIDLLLRHGAIVG